MLGRLVPLTALALALFPAAPFAQPSALTSTVPTAMRVVAPGPGAVDLASVYVVTVRDAGGFPLEGETVALDFSGCPHVKPASEQSYGDVQADCIAEVVSMVTNSDGEARFLVQGSVVSRAAAGTGAGCVLVSAGSPLVPLGNASPSAFDEDGVNGLGANDLSLWLCDFVSGLPLARSDYDGAADVGVSDLSLWIERYFGRPTSRTAPRCDGMPVTTGFNAVPDPQLRLAWNGCEANGGTQTRTFACNTNAGSADVLEASFIAPAGVDNATGFEAEIEIVGDEFEDLASWWRLDPGTGCRSTSLSTDLVTLTPLSCEQAGAGMGWVGGARMYGPIAGKLPNRGRIRILGAVAPPNFTLVAGTEYTLFNLRVNHSRTVGTGSCSGCGDNVAFLFRWLRITQSATPGGGCDSPPRPSPGVNFLTGDFEIRPDITGDDSWIAFWQGQPAGWNGVLDSPDGIASPVVELACTNPARGSGQITLSVPRAMRATLALYDIAGRRRRTLLDENVTAGPRGIRWDGRDDTRNVLASGYYALRLVTEAGAATRTMIVVH